MEEKEFLEKTDKANEELIKSNNLSQETKSLGNKLLLFSVILLLTSLKLIKLSNTSEIFGINITANQESLNGILLAVVVYFFVQFLLEVLTEWSSRKNVLLIIELKETILSEINKHEAKIIDSYKVSQQLLEHRLKLSGKELDALAEKDGLDAKQAESLQLIDDKGPHNKGLYWLKRMKWAIAIKKWRIGWQIYFPSIFAIVAMTICILSFF